MQLHALFCAFSLLISSVAALAVTGVPGNTETRLEIRELAKNSKQFTLYILALQQFQAMPQSTQTSYYQIAGIHGVPLLNWDGVQQCGSCGSAYGYCTHDSILFLGWHRTYLALFEQQLVSIAKSIANTYPSSTRASYVSAANSLRLPFWDWAAKPPSGNNIPSMVTATTMTVTGPNGKKTIANPLYSHHFASEAGLVYSPFVTWPNTLRYPTSDAASASSNEGQLIAAFNNIRGSLQDQVYQLFSTCNTFEEVGLDTASTASNKCSNSLEMIHNTVHTTCGGPASTEISGGHMTYLQVAAFDPVFWLHHVNVDRLFALWQGVYPNSYSGSQIAQATTWTIPQGSKQGMNSALTPFHNPSGSFWTPNAVRDWKTFNYNYPEYANSNDSPSVIKQYINNLYGPNADLTAGQTTKRSIINSTPLIANNGSLYQYVANIETARYALNGSYNIFLFNGNPASEDPDDWIVDPSLIGLLGILASQAMASNNIVAAGSIPLTRSLSSAVSGGVLSDLTEAMVVPYLIKNLQWRIAGPNGEEIDPSTVPDFDITVYASTAPQVANDALPVWSTFIPLEDVTKDRASAGSSPSSASTAASATSTGKAASDKSTTTKSTTNKSTTTKSTTAKSKAASSPPNRLRKKAEHF